MRLIAILTASLLLQASYSQDVWIKRDSVNGPPRGAASSFALNSEAFVVGGVNVEEFKRKMYSYDLDQDDWDNELPLGGETGSGMERASAVGFSAAGYGFIALGSGSASYMKDLWRYDPETESWTQMANFTGTPRNGAIAFSIDHIAYVGTGQDAEELNNDFYKYNPVTNVWTELGKFDGAPRKEAVGFTMGGKGYVGTGRGSSGYFVDFWEYDPVSDEWAQKADFPGTPRMGAVGCGVFPSAFIMMGEDNSFEYNDDVWEYNYFGNVWTQRADYIGGGRTQASAIVVDNRIFVGLGYNGIYHDDFYEYERVMSLSKQNEVVSINLFPNPVVDQFTVSWSEPMLHPRIQVLDANGKNISDHFNLMESNPTKITVNIHENMPSGYYFVAIYSNEVFKGVKKFILQ